MTQRFALYYAPEAGTALSQFGADWFGRSAESETLTQTTGLLHISDADWHTATSTAAGYGFHGTLKPPFRLRDGTDARELYAAVETLALSESPVALGRLKLTELGGFLALTPEIPASVSTLAARCVQELDAFRAPPSAEELARRRAGRLTPAQDALLKRWGYPYVMDEFRFHLTLTGRLDHDLREKFQREILSRISAFIDRTVTIADLSVFVQESPHTTFRLVRRFRLKS